MPSPWTEDELIRHIRPQLDALRQCECPLVRTSANERDCDDLSMLSDLRDDEPDEGARRDMAFQQRLVQVSGSPLLFNVIVINDQFPEVLRARLKWLEDANARGSRIFGQALPAGAHRGALHRRRLEPVRPGRRAGRYTA